MKLITEIVFKNYVLMFEITYYLNCLKKKILNVILISKKVLSLTTVWYK